MNNNAQQHVFIQAFYKGQQVDEADCTVTRGNSTWQTKSQTAIDIPRGYASLHIVCSKQGYPNGSLHVPSTTSDNAWVNRLAGGILGNTIDLATGANQCYAPVVTIYLGVNIISE